MSGASSAEVRFSHRHEGDFSADSPQLRSSLASGTWTGLRQQHGAHVVTVSFPGDADGDAGDAVVTAAENAVLSVRTADCAPIALVAREGVVGLVHAGWRGLVAGVVEAAASRMRELGGRRLSAVVGPCIGPECYEFDSSELRQLAERLGPEVVSRTAWGTSSFDIPAAVRGALRRAKVSRVIETSACTACDAASWFSHRARRETARHVLATWISRR